MQIENQNLRFEADIKELKKKKKMLDKRNTQYKRKIDDLISEDKKLRLANQSTISQIKEYENQLSGITKEKADIEAKAKELEHETKKLMDEQHIFVG